MHSAKAKWHTRTMENFHSKRCTGATIELWLLSPVGLDSNLRSMSELKISAGISFAVANVYKRFY